MEGLVGIVQFSVKNHARYQGEILEKRLHETRVLVKKELLDAKKAKEVAILIERSAQSILQGMREQQAKDPAEVADIAVRTEALLRVYNAIFRRVQCNVCEEILGVINRTSAHVRAEGEQTIHAIVMGKSGLNLMVTATEALRSAERELRRLTIDDQSALALKFVTAKEALALAQQRVQEEKYSDVFELSNRAKAIAIELRVMENE